MEDMNLFGFQVKIDSIATQAWYASAENWGCECGHCSNFLKIASDSALPAPVIETLNRLGIPEAKATYVGAYDDYDHRLFYQFSYRISGQIISGDTDGSIEYDWGAVRCCHETYPYGAPDFPTPHFDLEFWIDLPWVLDPTLR